MREEVILTEKDIPGAYLSKSPSEYHLPDLKRWLECHGQKKKGKLPEVGEKVRGCMALKLPVDPGVDGGKWYELKKKGSNLASASSEDSSSWEGAKGSHPLFIELLLNQYCIFRGKLLLLLLLLLLSVIVVIV